ncbi:four-carbon acid sugar kinase family protein [Devosia rhodophyticola]|uniref:Four-carbon acid sugar kinase family protein n=1 Tax=Devosia rhodophyticola TaxID=3026423 RepID=A0ABY7YTU4_9HYPH|nr:four-carbon acid sugar kinase family protein [Devosia rhodophyticola]WDR04528.1 four-carbon acid sugar kinase family protein [Devosia rhodophyticola]
MFLGCIADDFTGATDLGALMAREGLRVSLHVGVPKNVPRDAADAMIIALKSRNIAASDAVAQSLAAARFLRDQMQAEAIYFKYCSTFDSTDKGNIGPVLDALMAELDVSKTIASPGFPENGRRLFMGHLFVQDRLLSESSLARHPLTPMTDPDIVRVLGRQRPGPVGLISKLVIDSGADAVRQTFEEAASGSVLICDVIQTPDLDVVAAALPKLRLYSGGSAMGGALARLQNSQGVEQRGPATADPATLRPIIFPGLART